MNFWTEIFIFLKLFFINSRRKIERKFKMIGIYKFENLINGHKYIGQSVDIERRYKDHIMRATNNFPSNSEYNSILHQAIRKYGIENFSFNIIEECNKSELNEKEKYWIAYYNSYKEGYNETTGGEAQESSRKINAELAEKIQNLLLTSETNYEDIHKKYNISIGRISEINTGKIWHNKNLQYPLRTLKVNYYCQYCGVQVSKGQNTCINCANKQRRLIKDRPSREELKELIRKVPFTQIGQKYNISDNAVRKWCIAYNLPKTKKEINSYSDIEWEKI